MKIILITSAIFLAIISLNAQVIEDTISEVPDQISIGDFSVVSALSQVTSVSIEVTADSATTAFNKVIEVDFDGVAELARQMNEIKIGLGLKNPKDMIKVTVYLEDDGGRELFEGRADFYLDKVYDKDGNVSYQVPQWAIGVYFTRCEVNINFPGAVSAALVDKYGNESYLHVYDDGIFVHGSILRSEFEYLIISTAGGQHIYEFKTGQRIKSQKIATDIEQVYIDKIQHTGLNQNDELILELYPEHNYVPVIETDFNSDQMILDVRSSWGYRPIAVHITQLDELRDGSEPTVLPYQDGMVIEGSGTIYIWFEFAYHVYGIAENGGGKG